MRYFDYTFYRIYSFYSRRKDTPHFTAILFLLLLKSCLLLFVLVTINGFTKHVGVSSYLTKKQFWFLYWFVLAVFFIIDIFRYRGQQNAQSYSSLFKSSRFNKIPMWLIFMQPLIVILITILFNLLIKAVAQ